MKIRSEVPAEETRIEIIPLIDVIFCILTFFILAALQLTRQQAISVDLPKAKTGAIEMQKMLIVSIDTRGQTYIEQRPVTKERLSYELQVYRQMNPEGLLVLYAAKKAVYNDVVQVIDLLRSVGGDRVALATLPESVESLPSPDLPSDPSSETNTSDQTELPGALDLPDLPSDLNLDPSSPDGSAEPSADDLGVDSDNNPSTTPEANP